MYDHTDPWSAELHSNRLKRQQVCLRWNEHRLEVLDLEMDEYLYVGKLMVG